MPIPQGLVPTRIRLVTLFVFGSIRATSLEP
jgi:hypothetical protein